MNGCDSTRAASAMKRPLAVSIIVRVNTWCATAAHPVRRAFRPARRRHPAEARRRRQAWSAQVSWSAVTLRAEAGSSGRVCALRKSASGSWPTARSVREATRKGKQPQPDTLRFAEYVIVFTTFPAAFSAACEILEWYRLRWQLELVFKRFKSLAHVGTSAEIRDDDSAKAWLYGKLLVALLVEKLIRHASAISPWGYDLASAATTERVA